MFFLRIYVHISHVRAKKPAKILQIFHMAKYFYKKNQKKCILHDLFDIFETIRLAYIGSKWLIN